MSGNGTSSSIVKANFAAGLFVMFLGILALFWLIPYHVSGSTNITKNLNQGFMPRVAAWCMIVLGIAVAAEAFRILLGQVQEATQESEENETLSFGRNELINTVIMSVISIIYMTGIVYLGFIFTSVLFLIFVIYMAGYRNIPVLLAISLIVPIGVEQLLWSALSIQMPQFPFINF